MAAEWTRQRIADLTVGAAVAFLDRNSVSVPVPAWALGEGAVPMTDTTGQRMVQTHPDDRQGRVESWWKAVAAPGVVVEQVARVRVDGAWVCASIRKVCLFDDPVVGAMVEVVQLGEAEVADEVDEVVQTGEFEETRWLIHTLDQTGLIIATEGMVEAITGRRPEDVIGQSVLEHIHPDGFDDALTLWMEIQNGPPGTMRTGRQRVVRLDGSVVWTEFTNIKRVADDGTVTVTLLVHDMSERRRQEAALRASQLEFQLLAEYVPAAVFRADADQRLTFRNERWRRELDDDGPAERLADIVHDDDRACHDAQLARLAVAAPGATASYEVRGRCGERILAVTCRSVFDLANDSRSYVGSVDDITATVRLRQRAERDDLTGLANRAATLEHLESLLAEDQSATLVLFVDLDGFKAVNDAHGHEAGDAILRELGRRLRDRFRPDDVVGRLGGDEFVVVARTPSVAQEAELTARVADALCEPIAFPGGIWQPSASTGAARGRPGDGASALVHRADLAMFDDKRCRKAGRQIGTPA
jgi:diguanylate cyclase (GGDEF)-like protein/PAS domain S-box-containing protein